MLYHLAENVVRKQEKQRVYWWEPKNKKPNIGDHVAYDLVNRGVSTKGQTHQRQARQQQQAGKRWIRFAFCKYWRRNLGNRIKQKN